MKEKRNDVKERDHKAEYEKHEMRKLRKSLRNEKRNQSKRGAMRETRRCTERMLKRDVRCKKCEAKGWRGEMR